MMMKVSVTFTIERDIYNFFTRHTEINRSALVNAFLTTYKTWYIRVHGIDVEVENKYCGEAIREHFKEVLLKDQV